MKISIPQLAIVGTLIIGVAAGASAHQGATGIVKERMDQMGDIAKAMKAMGAMFKGQAAYDATQVSAFATEIAASGGTKLSDLFPENSLKHPSEAREEIWTDWDKFVALADEMKTSAEALANGAANPADGSAGPKPADLFRDLAGTCKGCHEDFRIKK